MCKYGFWLSILLGLAPHVSSAEVVIVNLSRSYLFYSTMMRVSGASAGRAGDYSMPMSSPSGFRLRGTTYIPPGYVAVFNKGFFRFSYNNEDIIFPEGPGTRIGYVSDGFNYFVPDNAPPQFFQKLEANGYYKAPFELLDDGVFFWDKEPAYTVKSIKHRVDFQSYDVRLIFQEYQSPGFIVDIEFKPTDVKYENKMAWRISKTRTAVSLSGSIRGKQVRFTGPRELGKFKGELIIRYVTRIDENRGPVIIGNGEGPLPLTGPEEYPNDPVQPTGPIYGGGGMF